MPALPPKIGLGARVLPAEPARAKSCDGELPTRHVVNTQVAVVRRARLTTTLPSDWALARVILWMMCRARRSRGEVSACTRAIREPKNERTSNLVRRGTPVMYGTKPDADDDRQVSERVRMYGQLLTYLVRQPQDVGAVA